MKRIMFLGQVYQHRREIIWLECLQAWIRFFGKHEGLVKTKTAVTGWCRPCVRRSVQRFLLVVKPCAYVPVAQLVHYCYSELLLFQKEQHKHKQHKETNRLILEGTGLHLQVCRQPGRRNKKFPVMACFLFIRPGLGSSRGLVILLSSQATFFKWTNRLVSYLVEDFSLLKLEIETRLDDSEILAPC